MSFAIRKRGTPVFSPPTRLTWMSLSTLRIRKHPSENCVCFRDLTNIKKRDWNASCSVISLVLVLSYDLQVCFPTINYTYWSIRITVRGRKHGNLNRSNDYAAAKLKCLKSEQSIKSTCYKNRNTVAIKSACIYVSETC